MRGEHRRPTAFSRPLKGSSPHARGAPSSDPFRHDRDGIIPACAGSTPDRPCFLVRAEDHPRMRGEHAIMRGKPWFATGSSPHARGARLQMPSSVWRARIIPACAGSTAAADGKLPVEGDHPRMRGEHVFGALMGSDPRGSSPHARGAQEVAGRRVAWPGIIPACAGSTESGSNSTCQVRDHPRMRGEHRIW